MATGLSVKMDLPAGMSRSATKYLKSEVPECKTRQRKAMENK